MKQHFKKYHMALFVIFFAIGFFWGKFYYYGDRQPLELLFKKTAVTVLTPVDFFSDDITESYHLQHQTQVRIITYHNEAEFKKLSSQQTYDILMIPSALAVETIQKDILSPLQHDRIKNYKFISADFESQPYDKKNEYMLPLFWGISGIIFNKNKTQSADFSEAKEVSKTLLKNQLPNQDQAILGTVSLDMFSDIVDRLQKDIIWSASLDSSLAYGLIQKDQKFDFIIPKQGTTLWTVSLAVGIDSKNQDSAYEFIDFLLQKEVILELVKYQKKATTHKQLESEDIPAHLKSSFIRHVSLENLRY